MEVMMPTNGIQLAMDCEDMFKEITKKLYGEEGVLEFQTVDRNIITAERHSTGEYEIDGTALKPEEHITAFGLAALMQNGFPPPGILNANFQPKINLAAEDKWTASEETLQWSQSKIASYNPAQKLFKCCECECVGFLSRIAEHWLGTHSNARVFQCPQCTYGSGWARCVRAHLAREHNVPDDHHSEALFKNNPVLDEITKYLQRLKGKVDGANPKTPPPHRPAPDVAAVGGVLRAPSSPPAAQVDGAGATTPSQPKRYGCPSCPYATDRRDLFTRHENIHRDEKPFECYVCQKQFNRADHVKKHFLRMHRDHPYDLNRIRRQNANTSKGSTSYSNNYPKLQTGESSATAGAAVPVGSLQHGIGLPGPADYARAPQPLKSEHIPHIKTEVGTMQTKPSASSKKKGDKRYSCGYCSWSGVDNWCLKRHLNTHLKPFVCALCDYKAARSERLTTHVAKVHNKKACGKCSYLADDQQQLSQHLQEQHHVENRNIKVPNTMLRNVNYNSTAAVVPTFGSEIDGVATGAAGEPLAAVMATRPPPPRHHGAARLFHYMGAEEEAGAGVEGDAQGFVWAGGAACEHRDAPPAILPIPTFVGLSPRAEHVSQEHRRATRYRIPYQSYNRTNNIVDTLPAHEATCANYSRTAATLRRGVENVCPGSRVKNIIQKYCPNYKGTVRVSSVNRVTPISRNQRLPLSANTIYS